MACRTVGIEDLFSILNTGSTGGGDGNSEGKGTSSGGLEGNVERGAKHRLVRSVSLEDDKKEVTKQCFNMHGCHNRYFQTLLKYIRHRRIEVVTGPKVVKTEKARTLHATME
jgi:hypothetical protein